MTSLASRIRGITYILLSITVFFSVLGFFTYYQVKQNEEYQHRLQFRELKAVSTDIANGAAQLREAISSYVGREKIVDGENLFSSATGALKKGVLYANHQTCSYHSNVVAPVVCLARGELITVTAMWLPSTVLQVKRFASVFPCRTLLRLPLKSTLSFCL